MTTQTLSITGMTCEHCARAVETVLNTLPGVTATVSYSEAIATVETTESLTSERLIQAVEGKGYGARLLADELTGTATGTGDGLQVAIIGSGSGAFACAIRATEEGAQVTLIEAGTIGGTCVNVGCVPSKIMIRAAQIAHHQADHSFQGLSSQPAHIDRAQMVFQQQARVEELRAAKYTSILDSNPNIHLVPGRARFVDAQTLSVMPPDGQEKIITADRILIATGSSPNIPNIPGLVDTPYWTSTEALVAETLPEHLIVMGLSLIHI